MSDLCTILHGDCRDGLRSLPAESVQTCVTSPPYFGLRDYGCEGQIGLEPTPEAFVAALVEVFREVRRVLRRDGTVWLNLGDSYSSQGGPQVVQSVNPHRSGGSDTQNCGLSRKPHLKPKDLIGIPWKVAFALQADGWYLRSDIIWAKPNPMPESVTDRPTKAHEYVFLLTREPRYFYDAEAVRSPAKSITTKMPDGWDTGPGGHGSYHRNGREKGRRTDKQRGHSRRHAGFNDRWDAMEKAEQVAGGANLRSVWNIATQPFPEAHFATFPEELARTCILAGTSEQGCCGTCGSPWRRETEMVRSWREDAETKPQAYPAGSGNRRLRSTNGGHSQSTYAQRGWSPSCTCPPSEPVPCTVLDPFAGSGTTLAVAVRHGRRAIGCELSAEYVEIIRRRVKREEGLFTPLGALEPAPQFAQPTLFSEATP